MAGWYDIKLYRGNAYILVKSWLHIYALSKADALLVVGLVCPAFGHTISVELEQ